MILNNIRTKSTLVILAMGISVLSCQKLDRPELGEFERDPDPPPYSELKSQLTFEENGDDAGENGLSLTEAKDVTYVDGVSGKAVKFGTQGYMLYKAIGDTVVWPNNFKGVPADTLTNLGSFTLAFWMNGASPVTNAQGLFSISNKNQFWGSLDLFLEGFATGEDSAFLKIHMFNANMPDGNGEEWSEVKIPEALDRWTHLALTYDAKTSKFIVYANGAAVIDKTLGGGAYGKIKYKDFNGMVVGNHQFQTTPSLTNHGPEGWASAFNGAIDNLRIYNMALTGDQVNSLVTGSN